MFQNDWRGATLDAATVHIVGGGIDRDYIKALPKSMKHLILMPFGGHSPVPDGFGIARRPTQASQHTACSSARICVTR